MQFPTIAGQSFNNLLTPDGLAVLDQAFLDFLTQEQVELAKRLRVYRQGVTFEAKELSYFLIDVAAVVERFLIDAFQIKQAAVTLQHEILAQNPIFAFKELYVLREAKRLIRHADSLLLPFEKVNAQLSVQVDTQNELAFASWAMANEAHKEIITQWCVLAQTTVEGRVHVKNWVSFHLPEKVDYQQLVPNRVADFNGVTALESPREKWRERDGFHLTDKRMTEREVLGEVHYCVYCHKNDGDFCSKGFPVKRSEPELGFKHNPLDQTLTGCPLEEKISEMHYLKKLGLNVAALAMVMLDNPMCPATGHRICNDCMKACIYQKQDPVNIPQIETRVLTDVLNLPWGVEIYHLLTIWNPLRHDQYKAKAYNGKKILVMGMGPAGFTLAHHLAMEGFAIVGVDGLKIEPMDERFVQNPIYSYKELEEDLADRVTTGFGGVAEYGITVRWDKNFLKLIYLTLLRRPHFQVFGNVRFGGTLTVEDAWRLGFDHLAIAVGAGLPRELAVENSLAPGMRQANDFLMALQLTGAAKENSLANLQLRLPVVVIGGGLTGIDAATEAQAYYISQVEKFYQRYTKLCAVKSAAAIRQHFDAAALEILDEFVAHGSEVVAERVAARIAKRQPQFIEMIRRWGGVSEVYRRSMQESPAYRSNHEEVAKALEEGVYYIEHLQPHEVALDQYGQAKALLCQHALTQEKITLHARSILVATGARPNVAYEFEHSGTFLKINGNYARFEQDGTEFNPVESIGNCKAKHFGPFTSYQATNKHVSFIGDTHPVFHGNVVKAIASAKRTYPDIVNLLSETECRADNTEYALFHQTMQRYFHTELIGLERLRKDVIKITVRSKAAAMNFKPGHFYRLQNYERYAATIDKTLLQSEAIATLAKREAQPDVLSFIILERGASTKLVSSFKVGQPLAVMGPTGVKSKVSEKPETVLIFGGDLAVAYVRAYGPELRHLGHQVLFAGYFEDESQVFCRDELEAEATDKIIWVSKRGNIKPQRPQDRAYNGELIDVISQHAVDWLRQVERIVGVGGADLIQRMQQARQSDWKNLLLPNVALSAAVFGPMQCMLKGVCAQCLVWQIDPATGERKKAVYSCSWQNQPLELIEAPNLSERLVQNRAQEIITNLWLTHIWQREVMGL